MIPRPSLAELWESTTPSRHTFDPNGLAGLPVAAQRFLRRAISPGSPLATAVRLDMHGEIKLRRWLPFKAEEIIHRERGMIWTATVRSAGSLSIHGYDRFVDGQGAMCWKLLKMIPVMRASGPDITRSAAGRFAAELIWLPSALARTGLSWSDEGPNEAVARISLRPEEIELHLHVDAAGELQRVQLSRWGNPDDAEYRHVSFGAIVEERGTFSGVTIPTRMRVGWYFGADQFESEGEFFRVTIDHATWR